jgi:anaerobic selenocysteine-containing dehydrogenase
MPAMHPKAQPAPRVAAYGFGEHMRVRGLTDTAAGLPTSALADEILLDGPGRVRALISCGGNPVNAWPDQLKTIQAMDELELLVQIDPWMSQTARRAHYVIAPKMGFEVPGINFLSDFDVDFGAGYTRAEHFGQYAPAIVDVPPGSELVEEWEVYYDLARHLGLPLVLSGGYLGAAWSGGHPVDRATRPTTDELLEVLTQSARVPLQVVKRHPRGVSHTDAPLVVAGRDDDCHDHLDVGRAEMIADLGAVAVAMTAPPVDDGGYDLRLICRRVTHVMNSSYNFDVTNRGRPFNPAFVHPGELARLGLAEGDRVRVESRRSSIPAVVMADDNVRPGLVSMSHSFGGSPADDDDYLAVGSCTGRLVSDEEFDQLSGQPRMSNVPVRLVPVGEPAARS